MAEPFYLYTRRHSGNYYVQFRLEDGPSLLSALTEKNIDVLEEIFKWDELMPSIQNFKEWNKERCKDAQRTYRDEQQAPIVDMFVSAFAKSNKAIKDGYDSQMFESATPELLRKITASGNVVTSPKRH